MSARATPILVSWTVTTPPNTTPKASTAATAVDSGQHPVGSRLTTYPITTAATITATSPKRRLYSTPLVSVTFIGRVPLSTAQVKNTGNVSRLKIGRVSIRRRVTISVTIPTSMAISTGRPRLCISAYQ